MGVINAEDHDVYMTCADVVAGQDWKYHDCYEYNLQCDEEICIATDNVESDYKLLIHFDKRVYDKENYENILKPSFLGDSIKKGEYNLNKIEIGKKMELFALDVHRDWDVQSGIGDLVAQRHVSEEFDGVTINMQVNNKIAENNFRDFVRAFHAQFAMKCQDPNGTWHTSLYTVGGMIGLVLGVVVGCTLAFYCKKHVQLRQQKLGARELGNASGTYYTDNLYRAVN